MTTKTSTNLTSRTATCPDCHKAVKVDYSLRWGAYYFHNHLGLRHRRCPESGFKVPDVLLGFERS